ncbi:MAG: type VI secretion system contractile sheath large subunit [Bryobacterales bacterium]|nr:type VI secretion system contractile sheath large subunit [Bryobacterales bacterium]
MPRTSYADFNIEVEPGTPQAGREPLPSPVDRDTPFRILVMGDFSGRASRKFTSTGPRKAINVDRDNFEDVLESLNVTLHLPVDGSSPLEIRFNELDDFHPDRLYTGLPLFTRLRNLRERLEDSKTFADAARELGVNTGGAAQASAPAAAPPPRPQAGGLSFLDSALEEAETRGSAARARSADPLANYISALVAPHLVPKADPKQKEVLQMADTAIAGVMCDLLHHPSFQELEAAWRGLYFLVKELETSPLLKVMLLDISRQELEADLGEADDLKTTAMYKLLVEQTVRTPGAHPWAVVVSTLTFGPEMTDLNLLARMGLLCRQAGAPLLGGASPALLGCKSLAADPYPEDWKPGAEREGWDLVRSLPESRWVGLILPRFMARMPYGKSGEQTDHFPFEELGTPPNHEHYLWGNAAILCAYLLGQNYAEFGWGMDATEILTLHKMPMHVYKDAVGDPEIKPAGEVFLTETAMEKIHEAGLMTLMSFANSDQVRLSGWRSIAAGNVGLSARWG